MIRVLLVESLEEAGFVVVAASSGDEAVQLLAEPDDVHAVVTDMQMPGGRDGNAVAAAAKARHPGIPVIYMTGNPSTVRMKHEEQDALLTKPFFPSQMIAVVERLFIQT